MLTLFSHTQKNIQIQPSHLRYIAYLHRFGDMIRLCNLTIVRVDERDSKQNFVIFEEIMTFLIIEYNYYKTHYRHNDIIKIFNQKRYTINNH